MRIIYSDQKIPKRLGIKSMFLLGPTPRDLVTPSWRIEALEILKKLKYDGTVLVPERRVRKANISYDDQVEWEDEAMNRALYNVFWIPRNLTTMPAFTTNVEFGRLYKYSNTLYGRPADAPKNRYLDWLYAKYHPYHPIYNNLTKLLKKAAL